MPEITLEERARALKQRGIFLGGPPRDFEAVGRLHLMTLLREGLLPSSRLLDLGCGSLRSGYWLIHFLDRGKYCGIEPDRAMLEAGIEHVVGSGIVEQKGARFSNNDSFDFSVFGETFDFVTARSVWTHASKRQIEAMLDSFASTAAAGGRFVVSYLPAIPLAPQGGRTGRWAVIARDYRGDSWVGHSHEQKQGGLVAHSPRWIKRACKTRGLSVRHLKHSIYNMQVWLEITRS